MPRRYVTVDVFSQNAFEGNPLAVVLEAEGLTTEQMQKIAAEFNYSETTFVLPPHSDSHTAQVRIFTAQEEVPFAGHPNIGTAFVIAHEKYSAETLPEHFVFEEKAGDVPVRLLQTEGNVVGAELTAPESLTCGSILSVESIAACLSIDSADIRTDSHSPQVASVGLPFVMVELATRDALKRCAPNAEALKTTLPIDNAFGIYAYTQDKSDEDLSTGCDIVSRLFTMYMEEDPATGSATVAAVSFLAKVRNVAALEITALQGVDMGRPSLLYASYQTTSDGAVAKVGGHCVSMMTGTLHL